MNSPVLIAAIVAFMALIQPLLNTVLTGRQRARERKEDWQRQDEVAAQAAEVAELLAKTTKKTNEKLDVIHDQATEIHTLVNSDMTETLEATLVALRGQRVLMNRMIAFGRQAGTEPSEEEHTAISAVTVQIEELEAALADRTRRQALVDRQAVP